MALVAAGRPDSHSVSIPGAPLIPLIDHVGTTISTIQKI